MSQSHLLSHGGQQSLAEHIKQISQRIEAQGDKPYITVARQLELLEQLQQFELGKFLLLNRGIDGYWTDYVMSYPQNGMLTGLSSDGKAVHPLEKTILETFPVALATQFRYRIFQAELQKLISENIILASVPCGLMNDLLTLNYQAVENFKLVGVDLDEGILQRALDFSNQINFTKHVQLIKCDAWNLNLEQQFDVLTSNGLNIYEPDNNRVIELYRQFYRALKPGGKLITSFLTPPPLLDANSEWNMAAINLADLLLQKVVLSDIAEGKWQTFRSSALTRQQLEQVGFAEIEFIYDPARIFPTVTAIKPV